VSPYVPRSRARRHNARRENQQDPSAREEEWRGSSWVAHGFWADARPAQTPVGVVDAIAMAKGQKLRERKMEEESTSINQLWHWHLRICQR
jgi:hypothetical protein